MRNAWKERYLVGVLVLLLTGILVAFILDPVTTGLALALIVAIFAVPPAIGWAVFTILEWGERR